jgi:hypothetical protein
VSCTIDLSFPFSGNQLRVNGMRGEDGEVMTRSRVVRVLEQHLLGLERTSTTVRAIVPDAPAIARVFLPTSGTTSTIAWAEVLGSAPTSVTRWSLDPTNDSPPMGDAPIGVTTAIGQVLVAIASCTEAAFAWWRGYGDVQIPDDFARFALPPDDRDMAVTIAELSELPDLTATVGRSPTRWIAVDGSWTVTADIYDRSLLVAGTTELIEAVLAAPDLEAVRVTADLALEVLR